MTERELDRRAAHRLAIIRHAEEVTGNVSKTCRYYGISRQAYYKWLWRYEEGGLDALRDRSSRPHESPRTTQIEIVGKVVYLRQTYHFGPTRSRCTSSAITTSRSVRRGSGGSSSAWT